MNLRANFLHGRYGSLRVKRRARSQAHTPTMTAAWRASLEDSAARRLHMRLTHASRPSSL
eukprot:3158568-Amphidinium_carterae.5